MFEKIEINSLKPIREVILYELRKAIFDNKLMPGDRLVENMIASSMGVSRTPVREALRQLEIEGLAINIPRKGTIVKGISINDAIEIYDIREVLEGLAVRLACLNITRIEIKKLKDNLNTMNKNLDSTNYKEYIKSHSEFNKIILYSSKNKKLIKKLDYIYEYLKSLRKVSLNNLQRREKALIEHTNIVNAIDIGEEILAERETRVHVINAKKSFIESYNL